MQLKRITDSRGTDRMKQFLHKRIEARTDEGVGTGCLLNSVAVTTDRGNHGMNRF